MRRLSGQCECVFVGVSWEGVLWEICGGLWEEGGVGFCGGGREEGWGGRGWELGGVAGVCQLRGDDFRKNNQPCRGGVVSTSTGSGHGRDAPGWVSRTGLITSNKRGAMHGVPVSEK